MTLTRTGPAHHPHETPFGDLAAHGDRVALHTPGGEISWVELADQVAARAAGWQGAPRLVLLTGCNSVDLVVSYLAALAARCPVLLLPPGGSSAEVARTWDPDIVVEAGAGPDGGTTRIDVRRETSAHVLHPDLALLLSTSGSTGSPKLVRLSRTNLASNAASIADYLALRPDDCGITSLPLHYCYGLSILHSHLAVGAPVAVTDASVVDEELWELAGRAGVTGLAGVPHTFELLEHSGFAERELPRLRYLTQAGGRLEADRVRAWHELGARRGWDLFVMYGQTEATARMAWLPPDLASTFPQAIGRAVPGGSLRVEPVDGAPTGVGELVYAGPNVMMGYAERSADLARPAMPPVLRTGDLARELPLGLFEVVGRIKRFTKVFGLRINLDDVERHLGAGGVAARVVGAEGRLDIVVTRRRVASRARDLTVALCGLPARVVHVHVVPEIPATSSGKVDYARLAALVAPTEKPAGVEPASGATPAAGHPDAETLLDLYAQVLGRPDVTVDDSFVDLGADSLSYVEMSVQLGARVDPLPGDWHRRPIRDLVPAPDRRRRWGRSLDTNVVLRALAILFIVGSHTELWELTGGAHLLLALAGFNFARFHLGHGAEDATWRRIGWAVVAIVLPASLWITGAALLTGDYDASTATYLNWALGSAEWDDRWRFWFLEALIWTLLALAVLFLVRPVRRLELRAPYAFALTVVAVGLVVRWLTVGVTAVDEEKYSVLPVFWCFALGWLVARSVTLPQRLVTSALVLVGVVGFFGDPRREALVAVGLLVALWLCTVRLPRIVASSLGVLAAASLAIYVTHWQVYPWLEVDHPFLAVVASVVIGVGYHRLTRPMVEHARGLRRGTRPRASTGSSAAAAGAPCRDDAASVRA